MAVTIDREPQGYTPSDSPVYFQFSSTQTAQPNFSFIVKVFVNGTQVNTRQLYPIGTYAYYDAVNEGRNYTSVPQFQNANIFDSADNNAEIYIEVYERYGSTPTTQPTAVTSSTIIVWKSKIEDSKFPFYLESSINNVFISDYDLQRKVRVEEQLFFMVANKQSDFDLVIKTYDSSDSLIGTSTETRTNTDEFTIINASPLVIQENTSLVFTGVDYFTIECNNGYNVTLKRININTDCKQSTAKRLHWISQIGGPESYSLDLVSKVNNSFESFGYKKAYNPRETNPNQIGRDLNTVKRRDKKIVCESNWLTDAESLYLSEDLVFSPVVYIESGGGLNRVKVLNSASEPKTTESETVFKETIEIGLGTDTSYLG